MLAYFAGLMVFRLPSNEIEDINWANLKVEGNISKNFQDWVIVRDYLQ
jgi:hypothetical protein